MAGFVIVNFPNRIFLALQMCCGNHASWHSKFCTLYSGIVTLDLTKAFDSICHARQLLKLDYYGVKGMALNLCCHIL